MECNCYEVKENTQRKDKLEFTEDKYQIHFFKKSMFENVGELFGL